MIRNKFLTQILCRKMNDQLVPIFHLWQVNFRVHRGTDSWRAGLHQHRCSWQVTIRSRRWSRTQMREIHQRRHIYSIYQHTQNSSWLRDYRSRNWREVALPKWLDDSNLNLCEQIQNQKSIQITQHHFFFKTCPHLYPKLVSWSRLLRMRKVNF